MRKFALVFLLASVSVASAQQAKLQTLADGTTWMTLHPGTDESVSFQMSKETPATGVFTTQVVYNRDTDEVNGPQSDLTQIQGDCVSRTYQIMGGIAYSEKNRGGYPMNVVSYGDLAELGKAGIIRRVLPNTSLDRVFSIICK